MSAIGKVWLVGAGPGDPGLITVAAIEAVERADVLVYDRLVPRRLVDLALPETERIFVGKDPTRKEGSGFSQQQINDLLIAKAREGKRVVRLKGGDPFVFGRGGEERDYLRRHGIAVQVVPGITAATACGASAGIPLTHRDHTAAVTLVTGHGKDGEPDLDWAALAQGRHTLVVYMGVATAARTAERLIGHGLAPATPVAVVENGTLDTERTVVGTLGDLAELIEANGIAGPAIIVIGEVARYADAATVEATAEARRAIAV